MPKPYSSFRYRGEFAQKIAPASFASRARGGSVQRYTVVVASFAPPRLERERCALARAGRSRGAGSSAQKTGLFPKAPGIPHSATRAPIQRVGRAPIKGTFFHPDYT